MRIIGKVKEIWHYPVKSMGGHALPRIHVARNGLVGDRLWAVLDAQNGEIRSARQWPALIGLRATYGDIEPATAGLFDAAVPAVRIDAVDGFAVDSFDTDVDRKLSGQLGKACRLAALRPPEHGDHYRLAAARDMDEIFREIDLLPGETPDFSATPESIFQLLTHHVTPPGTYFDSFPLHVVSTRTLATLAKEGAVDTAVPRFRPNLVLDLDDDIDSDTSTPEMDWVGRTLHIGDVRIRIEARTMRCSIPSRAQPLLGIEVEQKLTRAMVDVMQRHVGIYASVVNAGDIAVGDSVSIYVPT